MKTEYFQMLMLAYLNIPYIYGGKNVLQGEDCSGLVCELYKAVGKLKTNDEFGSQELFNMFEKESKSDKPAPGSLVFYGKDQSHIDHVAIFIDSNFILEAGHGTAETLTKEIAAKQGSYSRVRPYTYRNDFIKILNIDLGLT